MSILSVGHQISWWHFSFYTNILRETNIQTVSFPLFIWTENSEWKSCYWSVDIYFVRHKHWQGFAKCEIKPIRQYNNNQVVKKRGGSSCCGVSMPIIGMEIALRSNRWTGAVHTVWVCTNAQICKCAIIANAIIIMKLEIALRSNTCSAHSAHNIVVESNVLLSRLNLRWKSHQDQTQIIAFSTDRRTVQLCSVGSGNHMEIALR